MSGRPGQSNPRADIASEVHGAWGAERWFVVQAQPHQERRAIANLRQQGYRPFCPCVRKIVRHARRTRAVLAPLFPGYFFAPLDLKRDRWRNINGTRGVVRIVADAESPAPVPRGVVEALLARLNADGSLSWSSSLEPGRPVRIAGGPFSDLVGRLEHMTADGRVRVLLDLLGRPVSVSLERESLIPVT